MWNFMRCSIALAIFLFASLAFTQNTNSGNIRGTVTDATGAVLPGVTVTVEDIDKGVTTTYVTDGSGLYDTGSIVPDHYTLTFTKDGFSTFVRGPITLRVQTLTVDGSLKVGATTQTVRVTTDVPLLQTETGAQSTTLPERSCRTCHRWARVGEFRDFDAWHFGHADGRAEQCEPRPNRFSQWECSFLQRSR